MKQSSISAILFLFSLCIIRGHGKHYFPRAQAVVPRFARSPSETIPNDCRYEKGPWQECDSNNGMQKRILTLRMKSADMPECPQEKFIERPCKKQCKYTKGPWTDCANGQKERIDKLREEVSNANCKAERNISKHCKKQCTYEKSEWSPCENGIKSKTLTLVEGATPPNNADCEPAKSITKACAKGPKAKRFRNKKNREQTDG